MATCSNSVRTMTCSAPIHPSSAACDVWPHRLSSASKERNKDKGKSTIASSSPAATATAAAPAAAQLDMMKCRSACIRHWIENQVIRWAVEWVYKSAATLFSWFIQFSTRCERRDRSLLCLCLHRLAYSTELQVLFSIQAITY